MTDRELIKNALEALDSDNPDIQLRAAIAFREALHQALERERNQTWTQSHWTEYERGLVAAEREACVQIIEQYRIPVGNSAAGELACEWTYAALKEIRDSIRARGET